MEPNNNNRGGNKPERRRENHFARPDQEKFKAQLAKFGSEIDALSEVIKTDNEALSQAFKVRKDETNENLKVRDEIDKLSVDITELVKLRGNFTESNAKKSNNFYANQQKPAPEKNFSKKANMNNPTFISENELVNEITRLEKQMMTSTLSLKEEKEMMLKIENMTSELRNVRQQEAKTAQLTKKVFSANKPDNNGATETTNTTEANNLRASQLEEIDKQLDYLRSRKSQLNEQLRNSYKETNWNPELVDKLKGKIRANQEKRKQIINERDELKAQNKAENEKYSEELQRRNKERAERQKEIRAQKEAEQKTRQLQQELQKIENSPHLPDYQILQSLYTYLEKLVPEKSTKEAETKTSKGKSSKSKNFTYDMHTLSVFSKFQISTPLKEEDLEPALQQVSEKMAYTKKMIEESDSAFTMKKEEIEKQLQALQVKD